MPLEVTVSDPMSTSNRTMAFSESPVRIGRNHLNEIRIDDPFVSEWHGTIQFSEGSVAYFDLGSTNGSLVDGQRLPKNVPAPLTDKSRILLGRIQLTISSPAQETGPRQTMAWGHSGAERPHSQKSRIPTPGSFAPPGKSSPSLAPSAEEPAQGSDATLLQRQRQILEAFSEAFIGLRKGYEQFGAEIGVRIINGRTALHRARTSREILDYLLQPDLDVAVVKRDLIAIFADFGIHHIAMMEAVTEGARALLTSLDPRANDVEVGGRLFSAGKARNQWKTYLERFDQTLSEDQELHAAIFGAEFVRAYAKVTLSDGTKREKPPDK